jgi:K+-transporting ATPase ATPase A chain
MSSRLWVLLPPSLVSALILVWHLSANTPFYNVTTALAMMAGRFGLAVPALALAGLFAQQVRRPPSDGTLPTDTPLFAAW